EHWSYWNWTKLITIGALLRRRYDNAVRERDAQTEAFEAFTAEQADRVEGWRRMVENWESDPEKYKDENPYKVTARGKTEADVRYEFQQEEAANAKKMLPLHDVSPSGFVYAGLELEDQQRRTRIQVELKKAGTTAQKIDVLALRTKLSRAIVRFRTLQATYTPGALQLLARLPDKPDELPEDTPLMLPSAMPLREREKGCVEGVDALEGLARDAQCAAALIRLRNQLHIKSRFMVYKKNNARHQAANTRSRTLVARNESKIRLHSEKYQKAWDAIRLLRGGDAAKVGFRKLRREDIRMMEDPEELSRREAKKKKSEERRRERLRRMRDEGDDGGRVRNPTENQREVSWIWTVAGATGSDAELEEALRIEWAKARVRSRRWKEEVLLLEEEYRRVLVSFEYEARVWEERARAVQVGTIPVEQAEGAIAYAIRKADMFRALAECVKVAWSEVHRGRGRKRVACSRRTDEGEEGGGAPDDDDGGGEEEGSEDERGDVHSDEEHLLGGDEDVY
ncbi:hypothetical protein C8F04DRAFT_940271, partial [Mycena alexandri]